MKREKHFLDLNLFSYQTTHVEPRRQERQIPSIVSDWKLPLSQFTFFISSLFFPLPIVKRNAIHETIFCSSFFALEQMEKRKKMYLQCLALQQ
jgi:hypothetical protein